MARESSSGRRISCWWIIASTSATRPPNPAVKPVGWRFMRRRPASCVGVQFAYCAAPAALIASSNRPWTRCAAARVGVSCPYASTCAATSRTLQEPHRLGWSHWSSDKLPTRSASSSRSSLASASISTARVKHRERSIVNSANTRPGCLDPFLLHVRAARLDRRSGLIFGDTACRETQRIPTMHECGVSRFQLADGPPLTIRPRATDSLGRPDCSGFPAAEDSVEEGAEYCDTFLECGLEDPVSCLE